MRVRDLLKKVGKGIVIAAASMIAGVTLGPIAGGAVGSFVAKKMVELNGNIDPELTGQIIQASVMQAPHGISGIFEQRRMEQLADQIATDLNIQKDDVLAALQYGLRDLQNTLTDIIEEMQTNRTLLTDVLQLASETDSKISVLMANSMRIETSLKEIDAVLMSIERQLERSFRNITSEYSGAKLDYERLLTISRLHRQNALLASRYGIRYDPELYVPRSQDEDTFADFLNDLGRTDKNIFLVLGDVGMGKTWFLARLSSLTLEQGIPSFYVSLRQGIRSLTGIFNLSSLPEFVNELEMILAPAKQNALIFLDGLDEMPGREARILLGSLATIRSSMVSFVLSCRIADWTVDDLIAQASYDMQYYIYENTETVEQAGSLGINTPVSVLLTEFTDDEFHIAIERYGITQSIPSDVLPLLRRPFILRLISHWVATHDNIPSITSHEFLELLAGTKRPSDSIFGRLGILTQRETLFEIVRQFILSKTHRLLLSELHVDSESDTFQNFVSSGILQLELDITGTTVTINEDLIVPILALTIERYARMPDQFNQLMTALKAWSPAYSEKVTEILSKQLEIDGFPVPKFDETGKMISSKDAHHVIHLDDRHYMSLLTDEDWSVRGGAAIGLGFMAHVVNSPDKIIKMIKPLLKDKYGDVRGNAALSLGLASLTNKGSTEIVDLIQPLLNAESRDCRSTTALGLGLLGAAFEEPVQLITMLQPTFNDLDNLVRSNGMVALGIGASVMGAPEAIINILRDNLQSDNRDLREGAAAGLGIVAVTMKDPLEGAKILEPLILNTHWKARGCAALGLGILASRVHKAKQALSSIDNMLMDSDSHVRWMAAMGISAATTALDDYGTGVRLLQSLVEISDPYIQGGAAIGLGLLAMTMEDKSDVLNILGQISDDNDKNEQALIGKIIGLALLTSTMTDSDDLVYLVRGYLIDERPHIRFAAAIGMGILAKSAKNPIEFVRPLQRLLKDYHEWVRFAAAFSLATLDLKNYDIPLVAWMTLDEIVPLYFTGVLPVVMGIGPH